MMNDPAEHDRLLSDLIGDECQRQASLSHGLAEVRRARQHRRFLRGTAAVALILIAAGSLPVIRHVRAPREELATRPPSTERPARLTVQILSDEELLDQFPDRAVALVGPSSNRRLIFLDGPQ